MPAKTALIWLVINTMIGSIISVFIYMGEGQRFFSIFFVSQIVTQTVAFPTEFVGYMTFSRWGIFSSRVISIAVTLSMTAAAVFLAIFLAGLVPSTTLEFSLSSPWIILFPSLVISAALTATTVTVETLRAGKAELQHGLDALSLSIAASRDGISVRTDGEIRYLRFADIVYLSSSGRSSVVHTNSGDYEVFQLLGEIEKQVPSAFLRIHKQFVVNTSRISRLRYYMGGRYNLYLNDEDENILPVGKSYLPALKQYLNV
jgi:hypothetical protein